MNTKSSLATSDIQACVGNYTEGRNGKKIGKITIHHSVIAKAKASDIARVFTNPKRQASANYCIGYTKGDICCSLYEENRAWTSSSPENDFEAITMEVANSSVEYPYPVSDDTLENIIELCVDICKRYNFRLNWTGDKNGTLTVHRFFAKTQCPGEYLMGKMPYIAEEVNKRLDEANKPKEEDPSEELKFKVGDKVKPLKLVNYNGTPLVQYDETYTIMEINGDRVVLGAPRGSKGTLEIWAAMNINDIEKI